MTSAIHRVLVLMLLLEAAAYGQVEVSGTAGAAAFFGGDTHALAGGAVSAAVRPRLRIGAEVLALSGLGEDRDISLMPVLSYEFGKGGVRPYLIGGAGLLRHRELTGTGIYWSNVATYGGGTGVKFFFANHWFVAPEVRAGEEPFVRASVNLGYRF